MSSFTEIGANIITKIKEPFLTKYNLRQDEM